MTRAGYQTRLLTTMEEFGACVELQKDTWGAFSELVPSAILYVAHRTGGVVAGALDPGGRLLGFVFGVTGWEAGRPIHWSDMLAVRREARDRGIGEALKRYQREVLLARGVTRMYWTFDPLESRNAHLNFARLGVTAGEYHRDLYGTTEASPLWRGIGTDRFVVAWEMDGERVRRRLAGEERSPGEGAAREAPLVNPVRPGASGLVECAEPDLGLAAPRLRVAIPADIQDLKERSPDLAAEWRRRTRAAFQAYLGRGYRVVELVREGEWSAYVLEGLRALDS